MERTHQWKQSGVNMSNSLHSSLQQLCTKAAKTQLKDSHIQQHCADLEAQDTYTNLIETIQDFTARSQAKGELWISV